MTKISLTKRVKKKRKEIVLCWSSFPVTFFFCVWKNLQSMTLKHVENYLLKTWQVFVPLHYFIILFLSVHWVNGTLLEQNWQRTTHNNVYFFREIQQSKPKKNQTWHLQVQFWSESCKSLFFFFTFKHPFLITKLQDFFFCHNFMLIPTIALSKASSWSQLKHSISKALCCGFSTHMGTLNNDKTKQ